MAAIPAANAACAARSTGWWERIEMDLGLRFWLRYIEDSGGLAERTGDGTLVRGRANADLAGELTPYDV